MKFKDVISVGTSCATKYQIGLKMFKSQFPGRSDDEYRHVVHAAGSKPDFLGTNVFDWKITPSYAVALQLESGFHGSFERDDLAVMPDGHVHNTKIGTALPHDFHAGTEGRLTERDLDDQYPEALRKHSYLVKKFLNRLNQPGPYLYVLRDFPDASIVDRIVSCLGASKGHDFHLLLLGVGESGNYAAISDRIHTGSLPVEIRKPPQYHWEGDDENWDAILGRFECEWW
jgi:hypothetical protein